VAAAPLGLVRHRRAGLVEAGADVPLRLAETLEKLARYDNPWLARKGLKAGWAAGLTPSAGAPEALLFLGCTGAVEPRAQAAARALAQVLAAAGLPYATLGKNEPCCGDVARQAGELGLWADQAERAREQIEAAGLERIVVGSPHCFDALAGAGLRARVVHYVQALAELVDQGRLRPDRPVDLTVAFHDPCFLARHHGLVAEPRRVLAALPGLRLRELAAHGRETLCCGGGGGRLWSEPEGQADLAGRRLAQAEAAGVQALVTACPYCLIMLQAASKNLGSASPLLVLDLAELVVLGLGLAEPPRREG
jgi:Fe-S oxidoreductase